MKKKKGENWAFIELITGLLIGIVLMFFVFFGLTRMIPDLVTKLFMPYQIKVTEKQENTEEIIDKVEENKTSQSKYVNSVLSDDKQIYHLTLWDDGTYEYTGEGAKSGTFGTYILTDNSLVLNYMFEINNDKVVVKSGTKSLSIVKSSQYDQYIDESITLHSVNQPAREGGNNFYTELYSLLKYYNDEQKKALGIN